MYLYVANCWKSCMHTIALCIILLHYKSMTNDYKAEKEIECCLEFKLSLSSGVFCHEGLEWVLIYSFNVEGM